MTLASKSTTPSNNNDAPPNGAPEGMLAAAVNDTIRQLMADVKGGVAIFVETKADMSALDAAKSSEGNSVLMGGVTSNGDSGWGTFLITKADIASFVTNDPEGGIYVPFDSDATGASGGFIRQFSGIANVLWYGADKTGVTDSSTAQQAVVDSGLSFTVPEGTYLGSGFKIETDKQGVTFEGKVILKAAANDNVLFWQAATRSYHTGVFTTDSNGFNDVWGMLCGPANLTQTTTLVENSHNRMPGIIGDNGLIELIVLQAGPDVGGTDSGCFYNTFPYGRGRGALRNIWLRSPPNAGGAPCNRNSFWDIRVGTEQSIASNTGLQIDAGDTNNFFFCNFEGVARGTSPNTTPTAVKIIETDPVSGADNNGNELHGGFCEACTRDVDNDNATTQFFGFGFDDTKSVFSKGPSISIGGRDPSQQRQISGGIEFTNVAGDDQLDSLKVTSGRLAFPTVQSATNDRNTQDDYDDFTFTPGITASTAGAPTFSSDGMYLKIGSWVYFTLNLTLTALGGLTGSGVNITGLPFTSDSSLPFTPVTVYYDNFTGGTSGRVHTIGQIAPNATIINLKTLDQNGQVGTGLDGTLLTDTSLFRISGLYRSNA